MTQLFELDPNPSPDPEEEMQGIMKQIERCLGHKINLRNANALRRALYDELKLAHVHYTKGKKRPYQITGEIENHALHLMRDQHPIIPLILRYRELWRQYVGGDGDDTVQTIVSQHARDLAGKDKELFKRCLKDIQENVMRLPRHRVLIRPFWLERPHREKDWERLPYEEAAKFIVKKVKG